MYILKFYCKIVNNARDSGLFSPTGGLPRNFARSAAC
jgi:hypothetical protein